MDEKKRKKIQEMVLNTQLLYCSADVLQFACVQLKSFGLQKQSKMILNRIQNTTRNNLNQFFRTVPKDLMKQFDDLSQDNTAYMANVMSFMALIPPDELEWFSNEVFKLSQVAVNRHNAKVIKIEKSKKDVL